MRNDEALTADEVAKILQVSKNKVYELKTHGELNSYNIGRKLRFTYADVQAYISKTKNLPVASAPAAFAHPKDAFIICGQDIILDVLSNYLVQSGVNSLRKYVGSYDSLMMLYKDEVQVASSHLWDAESGEYNVSYVKRLLPGIPAVIVHLTCRIQGFYVAKGNPLGLRGWKDLLKPGLTLVNREKGAGSRVLLDEHMRLLGANAAAVNGYHNEIQSHFAVASMVARGRADVAIGNEKIARQMEGVDFVPLQKERYDLVVKESAFDTKPVQAMMRILESGVLREDLSGLGGYDTSEMGKIITIN